MVFVVGVGDVNHVKQNVGLAHLVEGRFKRLDELGRKLADEAHRVGQQKRKVSHHHLAHGRVEGGKKLVFGQDFALAKRVHEGGLANVGVADQGHAHEGSAVAPLGGHLAIDDRQLLFEVRNFLLDDAAVGLDLGFAGAAHADSALLALEVSPHARQAGQQVLVLGEFDLGAGVRGLGPCGKDVEDEVGAVHHLALKQSLDVFELRRTQFVVKNDEVNLFGVEVGLDFVHFSGTEKQFRIRLIKFLRENGDGFGSGGLSQKAELVEVFVGLGFVLEASYGPHKHAALRALAGSPINHAAKLEQSVPGNTARDEQKSQSHVRNYGLLLAAICFKFFEARAAHSDEHDSDQVDADVLDGKEAEFGGAHDFAGILGKESEPRTHEVESKAQKQLQVAQRQGGNGEPVERLAGRLVLKSVDQGEHDGRKGREQKEVGEASVAVEQSGVHVKCGLNG